MHTYKTESLHQLLTGWMLEHSSAMPRHDDGVGGPYVFEDKAALSQQDMELRVLPNQGLQQSKCLAYLLLPVHTNIPLQ